MLEAVAIGIEGELDGKHESEYEESQEDGLVELRAPDAAEESGHERAQYLSLCEFSRILANELSQPCKRSDPILVRG